MYYTVYHVKEVGKKKHAFRTYIIEEHTKYCFKHQHIYDIIQLWYNIHQTTFWSRDYRVRYRNFIFQRWAPTHLTLLFTFFF